MQELRQWQAEWREENGGIKRQVSDFWEKKMPDSPKTTQEDVNKDNKTETPRKSETPTKTQNENKAEEVKSPAPQ